MKDVSGERVQSLQDTNNLPVTYGCNHENQGTGVWTLGGFTGHEDRKV